MGAEGASPQNLPKPVGISRHSGRYYNVYSDGTLLPLIAGGSVDTAMELPLLLTVEETADVLRIGRTYAFAMVKSGEIESILIGKRGRRVPREAVLDYIATLRQAKD
ncbi:helix-turn-helix domain-containing protein [Streptosporangium sp. KLBMP 9127]|nr:helix-turn-helix domain-containing protein [Streptosporangium sp. KLBMP 9127]